VSRPVCSLAPRCIALQPGRWDAACPISTGKGRGVSTWYQGGWGGGRRCTAPLYKRQPAPTPPPRRRLRRRRRRASGQRRGARRGRGARARTRQRPTSRAGRGLQRSCPAGGAGRSRRFTRHFTPPGRTGGVCSGLRGAVAGQWQRHAPAGGRAAHLEEQRAVVGQRDVPPHLGAIHPSAVCAARRAAPRRPGGWRGGGRGSLPPRASGCEWFQGQVDVNGSKGKRLRLVPREGHQRDAGAEPLVRLARHGDACERAEQLPSLHACPAHARAVTATLTSQPTNQPASQP
jgi:hypothetical protein